MGKITGFLEYEREDRHYEPVEERIKHWLGVGALPSDRVARFLGDAGLVEKPALRETPSKSTPKAKAQARAKEAEEAAGAASGSA